MRDRFNEVTWTCRNKLNYPFKFKQVSVTPDDSSAVQHHRVKKKRDFLTSLAVQLHLSANASLRRTEVVNCGSNAAINVCLSTFLKGHFFKIYPDIFLAYCL